MRALEATWSRRHGPGKRTFFVAKELALDELGR